MSSAAHVFRHALPRIYGSNSIFGQRSFSPKRGLNVVKFWSHVHRVTDVCQSLNPSGSRREPATGLENISLVPSEWPLPLLLRKGYGRQNLAARCPFVFLSPFLRLLFGEPQKLVNQKRKTPPRITCNSVTRMLACIVCITSFSFLWLFLVQAYDTFGFLRR